MAKGEWETLNPPERRRVYDFPNRPAVEFANISRIKVSESGTHYLECDPKGGLSKFIVETNGRIIGLDMDAWTF